MRQVKILTTFAVLICEYILGSGCAVAGQSTGTIHGAVSDGEGRPVKSVVIEGYDATGSESLSSGQAPIVTDALGRFTLIVPQGRELFLSANPIRDGFARAVVGPLVVTNNNHDLRVVLREGIVQMGRVTGVRSTDTERYMIYATDDPRQPMVLWNSAAIDARGEFRLYGVPRTECTILIESITGVIARLDGIKCGVAGHVIDIQQKTDGVTHEGTQRGEWGGMGSTLETQVLDVP